MVARQAVIQVSEQLDELLREVVGDRLTAVALERERRERIGSGGAAEGQVDASGEQARRAG